MKQKYPLGTGMGDILEVNNDFTGGGSFINVNTGNIDLSAYDGIDYTISFDRYSHQDIDDNAYVSPNGAFASTAGSFIELDGQSVAGGWISEVRTGTVDASLGGGLGNVLFVSNTQGTDMASEGTTLPRYYIDNIVVSVAAVPEPSSIALLGLIGGLFTLRRRK